MEGGGCMIEFRNVSFSYSDSTDDGLKNIDITIPDGQCILLCGRSGCGKTPLTRLINGLIPQFFAGEWSGEVLLDGENLADLCHAFFRLLRAAAAKRLRERQMRCNFLPCLKCGVPFYELSDKRRGRWKILCLRSV